MGRAGRNGRMMVDDGRRRRQGTTDGRRWTTGEGSICCLADRRVCRLILGQKWRGGGSPGKRSWICLSFRRTVVIACIRVHRDRGAASTVRRDTSGYCDGTGAQTV